MLAPFGVEQGKTLTSACPGQGQTDSRTTTHSKFSWFPKLPDSNSQRGPWVTDVPPDAGRHPLRYQSELETGSLVPNFYHGSAVWLKGPKAKCQRGHVITWLYKIYIRQVKLTTCYNLWLWFLTTSYVGFFSKWWPKSPHSNAPHITNEQPKWRGGIAHLGRKERICGSRR